MRKSEYDPTGREIRFVLATEIVSVQSVVKRQRSLRATYSRTVDLVYSICMSVSNFVYFCRRFFHGELTRNSSLLTTRQGVWEGLSLSSRMFWCCIHDRDDQASLETGYRNTRV